MIQPVALGRRLVGPGQPAYITAEIGINHNGDLDIAQRLIDAAVLAGCSAVKFQKRTPLLCVPPEQQSVMRETPWGMMTYLDYRYRTEFGEEEYRKIASYCAERDIDWFASCWDVPSIDFIETFDPICYKVASASITDLELLGALRATGRPIILSTGMSTIDEIDAAVDALDRDQLVITHSTSSYPCPPAELNLSMIGTLAARYEVPVGYSGHETGLSTTIAAVAMGACFIERHITLDRAMWGSDQAASVEPGGLARLVRDIRVVELATGDGVKTVYDSELPIAPSCAVSAEDGAPGRRVSFAVGTWQLVVLLACLDQADGADGPPAEDHLVLYGLGLPDTMRRAMDLLAATRAWTSILWVDELLTNPKHPGGQDVGGVVGLRDRLGFVDADEIWLCKLFDFPEKVAAEALPGARIQLYEDGMHFYVPQATIAGTIHDVAELRRSVARRSAKWILGRGDPWWSPGVWASHVERVAGCWAVLPAWMGLPLPTELRREVEPQRIRGQLTTMAGLTGAVSPPACTERPLAIVLGQAFSRFGLVTEERELAIYTDVCRGLLDDGFTVLWKDHPRLREGFGPRLIDALGSAGPIEPLSIAAEWPVEAAVAELRPSAVVSATSTSLFLCAALFGTSCYSFAGDLGISRLRRDHHWMVELSEETFPAPRTAWRTFESSVQLVGAS